MASHLTGPFRVRIDGVERSVTDWAALVALARDGQVEARTPIRLPDGAAWVPAREVEGLATHFAADPWAAWEDADEDSIREALDAVAGPGDPGDFDDLPTHPGLAADTGLLAAELDAGSIAPLEDDGEPAPREFEALPEAAMSPIPDAPQPARGKVIAFPRGRAAPQPAVDGSSALLRAESPIPIRPPAVLPQRTDPPPPTGPRWGRLAALGAVGLLLALVANWVVATTAGERFGPPGGIGAGPPPADAPVAGGGADPAVNAAGEPDPASTAAADRVPTTLPSGPYADIEREIRSQWLADPRDLVEANDLEDALYVELPRVHIQLVRAKAPITEWGGRRSAQPQAANFLIRYEGRAGERDRELAAIALVVGRYMSIYKLRSDQLTIEIQTASGGTRRIAVDPTQALRLYEQRITIVEFLEQLAKG